jgi:hypothetical protein
VDRLKCERAKRFGFVGEAEPKYMGSKIDFAPPREITVASINNILDKIRKMESIERICWNVSVEKCICPVKGNKYSEEFQPGEK